MGYYDKALELAKTGKGKLVKSYIGFCYGSKGDYKNAIKHGNKKCVIDYAKNVSNKTDRYNAILEVLKRKLTIAQVNKIKYKFLSIKTRSTAISNQQKINDCQDLIDLYSDTEIVDGKRVYCYDSFLADLTLAIARFEKRMNK